MELLLTLVVIVLSTGELAFLEFGRPIDPKLSIELHLKEILADYENKRDELWDLPLSDSVPILLRFLENAESNPKRLVNIIHALGWLGRPQGSNPVKKYLTHSNSEVPLATIRSLGQMGSFSSIPRIELYLNHRDRSFRRSAIIALGKFGKTSVLPGLRAAAGNDAELLRLVEHAQNRISAIAASDFAALVDVLIETDEYEDLMALFMFVWRPVMNILFDSRSSNSARVHATRLLSLGRARKAGRRMSTIMANKKESIKLRLEAVKGVGRCKITSAVDELIKMLYGSDFQLQEAAVNSLGQIGKPKAFKPLIDKWEDSNSDFRKKIRLAIRRLCQVSGTEFLTELLRKKKSLEAEGIYFIDDDLRLFEKYQGELIHGLLNSESVEARRDAALLLIFFGQREDAEKLEKMKEQEEDAVNREIATRGFYKLTVAVPKEKNVK